MLKPKYFVHIFIKEHSRQAEPRRTFALIASRRQVRTMKPINISSFLMSCAFGLITLLFFNSCSGRQKDPDELVEDEYISEINGIYYFCDCEEHCGEKTINARGN